MSDEPVVAGHYSAHYGQFEADVHARVRRDAFGEDVGQNSWLTLTELKRFSAWLDLGRSSVLLDVACGSGGPALHLASSTGCSVTGVELFEEGVATANRLAAEADLQDHARFVQADANKPLPFDDAAFDAIMCIDSINHLGDRHVVLSDWERLLQTGGRVLFTDPLVITGPVGSNEIAIRTSIGFGLLMPPGENERLLRAVGLQLVTVEDTTESKAKVAKRRHDARATHERNLRNVEGDELFEARQRFFNTAAILARERRLSRYVFLASK